jgi:hypothetical protein
MSYIDLSLDRTKIKAAILELNHIKIDSSVDLSSVEGVKYTLSHKEDPDCISILNIFHKESKTSMSVQGKNPQLGKEVADHIKNTCTFGSLDQMTFIFLFNKIEVDLLKDFLISECNATVEEQSIQNGIKYTFKGVHKDSLIFAYYRTGKLVISGRQQFVYHQLVEALNEVLDQKESIKKQLEAWKNATSVDATLSEFETHFPQARKFFNDKLVSLISPSLILRDTDLPLSDYSLIVYPVLKGIEGTIKHVFAEYGIEYEDGQVGNVFKPNYKGHLLIEKARKQINSSKIANQIGELYTYFARNRHSLFHVDDLIENTRIISTIEEARNIITDCIKLIESTYLVIQQEDKKFGKTV